MEVEALRPNATVLICRLSHIGDCILTMPLACAIREQRPDVRIAWVVESPTDQLLRAHPAVDDVVLLPKLWRKSPSTWGTIRRRLQALKPDVTLDPQSLSKSSLLAWLSGAPRRLGFQSPRGRELAPWLNNVLMPARDTHLLDRTLTLLKPLGLRRGKLRYDISVSYGIGKAWDQWLVEHHIHAGFALMNPGGSWASKRWPPVRFGAVARELGSRYQLPTLVTWSGAQEHTWGEEIVASSGGQATLAPATDLCELSEILRKATFFLGSDTGPMHLASAVGIPCVVLYGPTSAAASGPVGSHHRAVQAFQQSSRNRKRASNDAMREIDVRMVLEECSRVLSASESAPHELPPRTLEMAQ